LSFCVHNMTIGDFFSFSADEYARRISVYDTERLRKQEVVKTRQRYAGASSIVIGAGGAAFIFGGTLAVSAYGGRRLFVADKKLELIRQELRKRGTGLRDFHKRDVIIPLCASGVGVGLGFGLDEVAMAATNTIPMGSTMPSGGSVMHEVLNNPGDVAQGVGSGLSEQAHEMAVALANTTSGVIPGSELSNEVLATSTVWVTAPSQAEHVGYYLGMLLAQQVEHGVIAVVGAQCAWSIMECMAGCAKGIKRSRTCPQALGGATECDECHELIRSGVYRRMETSLTWMRALLTFIAKIAASANQRTADMVSTSVWVATPRRMDGPSASIP
jgi:hypothetical protein